MRMYDNVIIKTRVLAYNDLKYLSFFSAGANVPRSEKPLRSLTKVKIKPKLMVKQRIKLCSIYIFA